MNLRVHLPFNANVDDRRKSSSSELQSLGADDDRTFQVVVSIYSKRKMGKGKLGFSTIRKGGNYIIHMGVTSVIKH